MPIQSKSQWGWMYANKPEMAHKWAAETKTPFAKLPQKVAAKPAKKGKGRK